MAGQGSKGKCQRTRPKLWGLFWSSHGVTRPRLGSVVLPASAPPGSVRIQEDVQQNIGQRTCEHILKLPICLIVCPDSYCFKLLSSVPLYGYTIICLIRFCFVLFVLPIPGYLGGFWFVAVTNMNAVNLCVQVFVWAYIFISQDKYWVKLLGHTAVYI